MKDHRTNGTTAAPPPGPAGTAEGGGPRLHESGANAAPLLWTLAEAATALRVSTPTLKRLVADGTLPSECVVRLGRSRRFVRLAVERWIVAGCPVRSRPWRR
jgi:excisionase family DNA binding protein